GSNSTTENQVRPGSLDDDNLNGRGVIYNEDEDDHDPAGPQFYDVALKMTTTAVGPFSVGQIVKFDINISNQGNLPIKNIEFVDYIPDGLEYVGVQNFTKWTYDVFSGYAISKIRQTLNPGQSAQTSIYLKIKYSTNYAFGWDNRAEIYSFEDTAGNDVTSMDIDSTPDGIIGNDGGGEPKGPSDDSTNGDASGPINGGPATGDEDDEDPERIEIFDLALKKELFTAGPYKYGQKLTFNIKVCNQGNIGATNIDVRNYIPLGFSFSLADNPLWTDWPTYTISSIVQPNTCFDIPLVLSVTQTDGGEKDWVSYAEIAAADNKDGLNRDFWDIDSSPNSNNVVENAVKPNDVSDNYIDGHDKGGEEDDHDPAGAKIFDLAIRKIQLTALPSFSYGQQVQFGISLFNQGNIDAKDIIIIDTLACGLEYINTPANTALGWVYNPATREVRSTYNNVLIAGANVQLTLDVKVIPCYTNPDKAWTNSIEIQSANDNDPNTSNLPVDSDSTPDNNNSNDPGGLPNGISDNEINGDPNNPNNPGAPQDEDDQDPHKIQLFDLALRKTVDFIGPYRIGETATFRIKIYNQGNVPAQNVVINDYIRSGFAFNAAANPGWTMTTAPTSSFDGLLNYTITSVLLPGDSIILPLLLEIALDENPAVKDWWNYAEIRSAQDLFGNTRNDDADSTPNTNSLYENTVEPDGPRDNVINGNGPNFNQDEDDHDPEKVIVVGGLGDTVWKDTDGDGKQDPGEFGVANVIATLTDCRGNVIQTTTTDATGFYFFKNLIPGDYQVQFDIKNLPKGCAFTFQNQGPDVSKDSDVNINGLGPCTNITGGEYDSTYDAGLLILAAIGDFVWHDVNGDGQQGLGEKGIAGMQVKLFKEDGTFVANKFTDVNGNYLFDFLYPGYYYLEFIDSSGLESTFYNIGNDRTDSDVDNSNGLRTTSLTYLAPGERDMTWDAGYYICVPIGDLVWYDINKNDVWDTDENGVNGLVVNLWRNHFGAWIIWQTKYSGFKPGTPSDDGYFKFCAPP
ncbi:MAG TPA: SdrD B-like domain-containing protein, partial [Saprospiraceae bacterium]|nr:SdrD B-like domain-containing protein [Saprospiraceae bacterium]